MPTLVTTYYLEMLSPAELHTAPTPEGFVVQRAEIPSPEFGRFLYTAVGGNWYWLDRLGWSYQRWHEHLAQPSIETWVGYMHGTPAGYFELERQPEAVVELVYFGLLPQFIGRGLGGALLTAAIQRAWQEGTRRVWVHTCSLDGPAALRNYESRGFTQYAIERATAELPPQSPGPWLGAYPNDLHG